MPRGKAAVWVICKICGLDYRTLHTSKEAHLKFHGITYGIKSSQRSYYFTKLEYVE